MDEEQSRNAVGDRILNDLRNIVKQIYYDSVNNELTSDNKTYLCLKLIKHLDEALSHGLKRLHLGYWRAIQNVLHGEFLCQLEALPKYNSLDFNHQIKGRTWIALALRQECFVNYIHCMLQESHINKYYEHWSIIRNNDKCNKFLSILSGLDNINFSFEIEYINKPPTHCTYSLKVLKDEYSKIKLKDLNVSKMSTNLTTSSSSLTSPVDSGVHIQDSSSSDVEQLPEDKTIDIDFLNGNVPETVMRRKNKKDTKRHVSFHEDIIYKSPDKCRKLKWDCENLRYSWSGEDLESTIVVDFSEIKSHMESSAASVAASALTSTKPGMDMGERGAPEGEETSCNLESLQKISKTQKSIIVKRFLQSIKKQSKIKQLSRKYNSLASSYQFGKVEVDMDWVSRVNREIESECENHWKTARASVPRFEVSVNLDMVMPMIGNECVYKAYELRDYLFIITDVNLYVVNKTLEVKKIGLECVRDVVIYPDSHAFWIWESKETCHKYVTGDEGLTREVMGRLELAMRRKGLEPPKFHILQHSDLLYLRRQLISRCVIEKDEALLYCGFVRLEKEMETVEMCGGATSKRGFLMYRDLRTGTAWIPGDFLLKGNILYLFTDGLKHPKFAVNLSTTCRSCSRTTNSGRPHTFQITIDDDEVDFQNKENCFYEDKYIKSKLLRPETQRLFSDIRQKMSQFLTFGSSGYGSGDCVLEFAAANETELAEWLQLIIQASCGDCGHDVSRDDVVAGSLFLTKNSLIMASELFSENEIEILSCAQINDIADFRIGRDVKDCFTLIEFSCMEATSDSGDWIIFMSSREEVEKLGAVLRDQWTVKNAKFPGGYLADERLINRCRKTQASLSKKCWTHLLK